MHEKKKVLKLTTGTKMTNEAMEINHMENELKNIINKRIKNLTLTKSVMDCEGAVDVANTYQGKIDILKSCLDEHNEYTKHMKMGTYHHFLESKVMLLYRLYSKADISTYLYPITCRYDRTKPSTFKSRQTRDTIKHLRYLFLFKPSNDLMFGLKNKNIVIKEACIYITQTMNKRKR